MALIRVGHNLYFPSMPNEKITPKSVALNDSLADDGLWRTNEYIGKTAHAYRANRYTDIYSLLRKFPVFSSAVEHNASSFSISYDSTHSIKPVANIQLFFYYEKKISYSTSYGVERKPRKGKMLKKTVGGIK